MPVITVLRPHLPHISTCVGPGISEWHSFGEAYFNVNSALRCLEGSDVLQHLHCIQVEGSWSG